MKHIKLLIGMLLFSATVSAQSPDRFRDGVRSLFFQPDTVSTMDRDNLSPKLGTILYHKDTGISQWETWDGTNWVEFLSFDMDWSDPVDADILPDSPTVRSIGSLANPFSNVYSVELNGISQIRTPNLMLEPSATGNTEDGTIYYDSDTNQILGRIGAAWVDLGASGGGGDALTTNPLSQFAATTSAQLRGVLSDEVGTGSAYFVGGALGTPASVDLTNATGLTTTGLSNGSVTVAKIGATGTPTINTVLRGDGVWTTVNFDQIANSAIIYSKLNSGLFPSQLQAEAGTSNDLLMTPLRTAQAIAALGTGLTTDQTNQLANQSARKHSVVTITGDVDFSASNQYVVSGGTIGGSVLNVIDDPVTVTVPNRGAGVDENYFVNLYGTDTKEFIPDDGVSFTRTNGALGDSTAIRFTGGGKLNLVEIADGVFDADFVGGEWFNHTPNLFIPAGITNADNYLAATYGGWLDGGSGTTGMSESTDDPGVGNCLTSIAWTRDQTSGTLFRSIRLLNYADDITGYDDTKTYRVSFYLNNISGTNVRMEAENDDAGDGLKVLSTTASGWQLVTYDFSPTTAQTNGGLLIFCAYNQAVVGNIRFTEMTITEVP